MCKVAIGTAFEEEVEEVHVLMLDAARNAIGRISTIRYQILNCGETSK
jgi:hypothetical protein